LVYIFQVTSNSQPEINAIAKPANIGRHPNIPPSFPSCYAMTWSVFMYKIPEIQKQYAKVKDDLELIDYKTAMAKYELDNMNNRLTILNRDIHNKRNEIAYLQIGAQELEEYVHGLENHNQKQQHEIQN
jgi:hypothetical protein